MLGHLSPLCSLASGFLPVPWFLYPFPPTSIGRLIQLAFYFLVGPLIGRPGLRREALVYKINELNYPTRKAWFFVSLRFDFLSTAGEINSVVSKTTKPKERKKERTREVKG